MPRALRSAFSSAFVLLFLSAAPAGAISVLNVSWQGQGGDLDVLVEPAVEVGASDDAAWVYADWWETDNPANKIRVYLDYDAGRGKWVGNLPANHAGTARFSVTAEDAEERTDTKSNADWSYGITENVAAEPCLNYVRYPDIYHWDAMTELSDPDDDDTAYWYENDTVWEDGMHQMISLKGAKDSTADPFDFYESLFQSGAIYSHKIATGVGSLWFKARLRETNTVAGTLLIGKLTTVGMGRFRDWYYHPIAEVSVPPSMANNQWYQFHVIIQDTADIGDDEKSDDGMSNYVIYNNTQAIPSSGTTVTDADRRKAMVDVCDVVLTPLIPDVAVIKDDQDMAAASQSILVKNLPNMAEPIEFHVTVSNLYAGAPVHHITPRLVWRQKSGLSWDDWTETVMTNVAGRTEQGDGVYACVLSADAPANSHRRVKAGAFEYFYEVSFAGYTPAFPAVKYRSNEIFNDVQNARLTWNQYPGAIHSEAWGLQTDGDGTVCECRAPAVRPDLWTRYAGKPGAVYAQSFDVVPGSPADVDPDVATWGFTHKFDLRNLDEGWPAAKAHMFARPGASTVVYPETTVEIPGQYDYYTTLAADGIRRFRSSYAEVGAKTSDHPEARRPSYLEPSYPMDLVGDYTWQGIIHVTNAVDAYFSVTGAYNAVAGSADYDPGPFEWIQIDQLRSTINPPMSGQAADGSDLKRFRLQATVVTEWIEEEVEVLVTNLVGGEMRAVGIVTNEEFYADSDPSEPADSDVVYWFARLEDVPAPGGGTETAEFLLDENWSGDATNGFVRLDYPDFLAWIDMPGRVTVTNDAVTVYTNVHVTATTETRSRQVQRVEWVPELPPQYQDSTLRTRVQIDYDGFLMYRMCTTNGSFQVRRAAWQDYNDWAADENYFSRSYGLFGMTVFESDVNGRQNTEFAAMTPRTLDRSEVRKPPETGTTPNTATRYADGLAAKNAWFEQDAAWTAINANWATNNMAIRLSTLPTAPGSVETTIDSKSKDGGRGNLTFRVRASARDTIAQVYDPSGVDTAAWSDYTVYAHVTVSSHSDAEDAGVSVYAYWRDEENWVEAKLRPRVRYDSKNLGPGKYSETELQKARRDYIELTLSACKNGLVTSATKVIKHDDNSKNNGTATYALKNGNGWVIALSMSGGEATARLYPGANGSTAFESLSSNNAVDKIGSNASISLSTGLSSGTIAFNASDAAAVFRPWAIPTSSWPSNNKLYPFKAGGSAFDAVCNSSADSWAVSTDRYWGYANPWMAAEAGGSTAAYPAKLERGVPKAYYRIQVFRTGEEESTAAISPAPQDGRDWDDDWDEIGEHQADGIREVESFAWQNVTVPMALWDDTFAKILALPYSSGTTGSREARATGGLAVDTVGGVGWRGKTVYDPDPGDSSRLQNSWIATYAAIVPDGRTEHKWALVRSRANPSKRWQASADSTLPDAYPEFAQSITTPLMENGVGDITFEYQATNKPVAFVVEMIDEDSGAIVNDEAFRSVLRTAEVTNVATRLYVPALRAGISGRLRIRTLGPDDGGPDSEAGTLLIDNLRATDYPNAGDSSWEAYNALVSTFTTSDGEYDATSMWPGVKQTDSKFDLQNMGYRSAVLNKTKDDYTPPPDGTWPDYVPYVQTPAIATGVGEISFWYRRAPDEEEPASLSLWVAKSQGAPTEEWMRLTPDNLNTNVEYNPQTGLWENQNERLEDERLAMAAITNITTSEWTYFSAEFFQQDFNVLRIYAGTNFATFKDDAEGTGNGRVMLDNVLITEPVRASIDVGRIDFDPAIPLLTGPTGAKVTLVNPRMGPSVTKVELDWYVTPTPRERLEITNRFINVSEVARSTNAFVYVPGVGEIEVFPEWTELHTNDMQTIETTWVPTGLAERWGYEAWCGQPTNWINGRTPTRGTLGFTNVADFVYVSTNAIPTDEFPVDTIVQYCARVEYVGRFSAPVLSETQGRMQNGFWFDNPGWYEPIDLNKTFGTTNQPAAHFWDFAVGTNVLVNELRTSNANAANKAKQFIELIGPIGTPAANPRPQIENWTIAHSALDNSGYPILGQDALTNVIAAGAAFHEANNATTNKGWGVYVIGNESVPGADQPLLPDDTDFFLYYRGAFVLRRSMGAYAKRVCWTSGSKRDVQDFIDIGYEYLGAMAGSASRLPTYALVPDPSAEEDEVPGLIWSTAYYTDRAITPGGFNFGQEDVLPDLLTEEEEVIPPLVSQPVITGYELVTPAEAAAVVGPVPDTWTSAALVTFTVRTTNDVALAKGDWTWYLQTSDTLPFPEKGEYGYSIGEEIGTDEIPADKDVAGDAGDEIVVTFAVSVDEENRQVLFYRIFADPKNP